MNRLIDFRFKYLSTSIFIVDSFPIFLPSSSHSVLDIFNILHQENKVKSSKRLKLKSKRCYILRASDPLRLEQSTGLDYLSGGQAQTGPVMVTVTEVNTPMATPSLPTAKKVAKHLPSPRQSLTVMNGKHEVSYSSMLLAEEAAVEAVDLD